MNIREANLTDLVCVLHTLVISPDAAGRGYGRAFVEFYEWWYSVDNGFLHVHEIIKEKLMEVTYVEA